MKNFSLFFIFFLLLQLTVYSQAPDTLWTRAYGGIFNDIGASGIETSDGGFLFTGFANTSDLGLLKTDANGNLVWLKTFGGVSFDIGYNVIESSDGGYVIIGSTYSYGAGGCDAWLMKVDSSGNQLWSHTFGGTNNDFGVSVKQTPDGGYIIAGYTNSYGAGLYDVWLIRVGPDGNPGWAKTYGAAGDDYGYSVDLTMDGGFVVAGYQNSFTVGGFDVGLLKVDANGNLVWLKNFGGSLNDHGYSVKATSDGGYIIAGDTRSFGAGGSDVWLIKTNSVGTEQWSKTYGAAFDDEGRSVDETPDGCFVITGDTRSFGAGLSDVGFMKADSAGNLLWITTFGGLQDDHGRSVVCTSDGGCIITGGTYSFGAGGEDVWIIKTEPDVTSITDKPVVTGYNLKQNFPNPFNPATTIKYQIPARSDVTIKVFGLLGTEEKTLIRQEQDAGIYEVEFNAEDLPSGVYFYQLRAVDPSTGSGQVFIQTKKMILLK